MSKKPLITIEDLKKYFPVGKPGWGQEQQYVKANDEIDMVIYEGETLGLVGESGCGKSTLGRTLLQLYDQTAGRTIYHGRTIYEVNPNYVKKELKKLSSNKPKLKDLKDKMDKALDEFEKDKSEEKLKNLKAAKLEYNTLMKDMTNLAGGLILSDNLSQATNLLEEEFDLKVKLFKNPSDKSLIDKLSDIENKIDALKEPLRQLEDFEAFENNRTDGVNLTKLEYNEMRHLRKDLQLIFQDPYSSLNPKMTVGQIISEGLYVHDMFDEKDPKVQEYIVDTMEACGLAHYFIHRYPHQFSGGQRQRIGIARSVALDPTFIVCDEAVSALDVSIQSQIINLLLDLKEEKDLTYLFISHDLSVIKYISDRVGVMYLGNIVELAPTKTLYENPMHPYTTALLSAIPTTDVDSKRELVLLEGDIPSNINPPKGCKFNTRCKYATDICRNIEPFFEEVEKDHFVACHHKEDIQKEKLIKNA